MDFQSLIAEARELREAVQHSKVPFLPPTLHCMLEGEPRASVLASQSSEEAVAGMFGMIPVTAADEVYVGIEAYVRPDGNTGPIAEDPFAVPAVVLIHVATPDLIETSINPYSITESGELEWQQPGSLTTPLVETLVHTIQELFELDVQDVSTARELCNWMVVNGYSLKVRRSVFKDEDDAPEA